MAVNGVISRTKPAHVLVGLGMVLLSLTTLSSVLVTAHDGKLVVPILEKIFKAEETEQLDR